MEDKEQIIVLGGEQKHQAVKNDGVCTCLTSSMGTGGGYIPMIISVTKLGKSEDFKWERAKK